MRRFLLSIVALAVLLLAPRPARADDAAALVPADRTILWVEVPDGKAAEEALRATDVGRVWEALRPFFEKIREGLGAEGDAPKRQFEEAFGVSPDDLLPAIRAGFAFAAVDLAPPRNPGASFGPGSD